MIYESRFLTLLRQRLADDLTNKHTALGNGHQIVATDAAATGMRTAQTVGEIAGLKAALVHIEEVEKEMSGRTKSKGE